MNVLKLPITREKKMQSNKRKVQIKKSEMLRKKKKEINKKGEVLSKKRKVLSKKRKKKKIFILSFSHLPYQKKFGDINLINLVAVYWV